MVGSNLIFRIGLWALAIGYLVMPIDFVPESIFPIIGYADDVVFAWLTFQLDKKLRK